ncbi:hypothetical protein LJR034_006293 [Caballeronia sp. LjRoot34]|uniref:hypothetical protein n=1 Tax=Caballeronia sp. LjRoot34 TaxID=3342325 RepID=UPI003ECFED27
MTTELTRYNGYRYVLRKGRSFTDDAEKIKAGRAMLMYVDMYVWESNALLVARVESFLQGGFSWYSKSPKGGRETLQTLLSYVRDGAVIVLEEEGATTSVFENGGFTLDSPARETRRDTPSRDYEAWSAQYHAERRAETLAIEKRERAAILSESGFPKHIETIAEAGARNIAARAASALLASVASFTSSADQAFDLGEVTDASTGSTPLGDASPFELGDMPSFGDSFDIAKTPNRGEPGTWYTNPGSGQMRLYGDTGAPVVDFDFDHDHGQGVPHAHNYGPPGPLGEFNRETGRSFSLVPW